MTKTPRLSQEEIQIINFPIKVIEFVIKNVPTKRIPCPDGFSGEFIQQLRNKTLHKYFQEVEKEGLFPNCSKISLALLPEPNKDITRKNNYKLIPFMKIDQKILTKH